MCPINILSIILSNILSVKIFPKHSEMIIVAVLIYLSLHVANAL